MMSPLWNKRADKQLFTIHKRPSPKYNNHILNLAQGLRSIPDKRFPINNKCSNSIKRISLFISSTKKLRAGMTVEAAEAVPLFLFFFINLSSAMEMMRLHSKLQLALWEVGNRMTVYGSVLDSGFSKDTDDAEAVWDAGDVDVQDAEQITEDSIWMELAGVAWSYIYVKNQLIEYLGKDYLENSPITRGADGLQFAESDIWESQDCFEIVLTYQVSPMSGMSAFMPFCMANKYYGHLWNGYEIPQGETPVYVAENGVVYHLSRDCTHLQLSVRKVSREEARSSRNEQGKIYTACSKCGGSADNDVYITDEGECYHEISSCPGLKRTVSCMWISEAESLSVCKRCKQESAQ